ncbi:MAG: hybrid sensor histidine kinase/response regulator transcription factor [Mucilaginibacter sp.]
MRMIREIRLAILFSAGLLFYNTNYTCAQQVKYLGIEQGLSNNSVTCIYKDHYGFMWIGTYDGLNKYDGDIFKTYRNIWGDSTSLGHNYISAIAGNSNTIFVGTQKGVSCYDYSHAHFFPLSFVPLHDTVSHRIDVNVNSLITDRNDNIYIATDYTGLLVYNTLRKKCHQIAGINGKSAYSVQALTISHNGCIFAFIKNTGLCIFNPATNRLQLLNNDVSAASCLLEDKSGNVWIGTENGLYILRSGEKTPVKFEGIKNKLTSNNITDLKQDEKGNLWIATNGGGVNILNKQTGILSYFIPGHEQGALRSGAISGIYIDDQHRKWIATLRGGINIFDDINKPFALFTHDPFNANSVINNFILSFCEDQYHNIWIGTDGGGLSYWNTHTNQYSSFVHSTDPSSLTSNFVVSILKDFKNQIWIATFSGGIDAYNPQTRSFRHYSCFNTATGNTDKNLWKLYEDAEHNLWVGSTRGDALYVYNRQADRFDLFDPRLTNIHTIFEDNLHTLWAGNYTQLIKIDKLHKNHQYYNIGYTIRAIVQDKNQNLWLGTGDGGLLLYNRQNNTYKRYTQADGLPNNTILNILVDDNNNLWCSTYNGLTEFVSATGRFINYSVPDGLQSNQFNYNAALKLSSGNMLFGGISGFNMFNPDSIKTTASQPKLTITDLKIGNTITEGGNEYTNFKPAVALKRITLPYNQATLAVDYTALEYSSPDKIKYAYYLQGWDHGWNYVGKLKTAYYTRLSEGNYILKIRATNTKGEWMREELDIPIKILAPWYRTWWAYLLYILITSAVIYRFWLYRIKQSKLKFEVQLANIRMEKEKDLNEKKLAFFTNVSHEFRTPLTLIINPIQDLLKQSGEKNEDLNVIYRNARRLLGLVDHLLLFRKAESENAQMKVSKINFVTLCSEVFMCFSQQAKLKKITYTLEHDSDYIEAYVDIEKIEISLFNLISNAIKFTPDGGNIKISIEEDDRNIYVNIADDGIGINADIGDKLFDKFYQVKDKNLFKTGFGIGLYLVKVFINNHKGNISYYNNANGGTTFVMSLPKGNSQFTSEQLYETHSFDLNHINELIDNDNKEVVEEEQTNDLELLISNKQSIIIIDDNDQIRGYIKKLLQHDYTVFEACNPKDGLETIKKYLPDLIISDIVMEEMSGLDLCKLIKQDTTINHIPIILLTGDATPEVMLKSMEEGAVDFLKKPFEKEIFIARVKSVLRSKAELQNYFYKEITLKNNTRNISDENKDFLYNCIEIIERNLTDANFDVDMLAKSLFISYPTLFKRLKAITGQSVNNFIRFVRLRKAAELLIQTNCNVNEVAYQVGLNDTKYFREHFKKQFGVNPSDFIRKHRANFQIAHNRSDFANASSLK